MKIIEKRQDPGGKWMVRVLITDLLSEFFAFDNDPTEYEIQEVVDKYIAGMTDDQFDAIKTPILKMVENEYCDFLKNDWSPTLWKYGLVPQGYEITVNNTNSMQNMGLLLYLKHANKEDYYRMAGEFDRYKRTIEDNGGLTARAKPHS